MSEIDHLSTMPEILRHHAKTIDVECAPEESDFWQAADEIEHLERMIDRLISGINALDLTEEQKMFLARKINELRFNAG